MPSVTVRSDLGASGSLSQRQSYYSIDVQHLASFVVICGRLVLNVYTIQHTFFSLPKRDPDEPLNEAVHIVSWAEFLFIYMSVMVFGVTFIMMACALWAWDVGINNRVVDRYLSNMLGKPDQREQVLANRPDTPENREKLVLSCLADTTRAFIAQTMPLAGFSAMKLAPLLSPLALKKTATGVVRFKRLGKFGGIAAVLVMIAQFAIGWIGVLAMMVKVKQLKFVSETVATSLSVSQWGMVFTFVSQVEGIKDLDAART